MAKAETPLPKTGKVSKRRELAAQQRKIKMFVAIGVGALLLIAILVLIGSYAFKRKPKPVVPVPVVDPKPGSGPSLTQPILDILMEDPILAFNISLKRHFAVTVSVLAATALLFISVISLIIYVSVAPSHVEPEPEPEPEIIDNDDMSLWELFSEDPLAALMRPLVAIPSVLVIGTVIGLLVYVFVFKGKPEPTDPVETPQKLGYIDVIKTAHNSLKSKYLVNTINWESYKVKKDDEYSNSFVVNGLVGLDSIKSQGSNTPIKRYMLDFIKFSPHSNYLLLPSNLNINIESAPISLSQFQAVNIYGLKALDEDRLSKIAGYMNILADLNKQDNDEESE